MMKASILIANYNNDQYIIDCINSLKKQTYQNIEIIFFDDNSKDKSLDVVKRFSEVKLLINEKEKKIHGSFNQLNSYKEAFKKCSGEIILFLDSDDYFHEEKIANVVKEFEKNNNLKIIFDLPIIKTDRGEEIPKGQFLNKTYWPYIPPQSCISISRKYIEQVYDLIDFDLFPNIWMDFRIGIVSKYILDSYYILNKRLTYYRKSEKNISSKFKHMSRSWWKRRSEAHDYIKYFFLKHKIKYKKNLDYYFTKLINLVL